MDNDLISIIVPIYNGEKYLTQCVESILSQTYRNLEILLVDDGSTDMTGLICDEYARKDSRVRVIHQENKGLQGARSAGIQNAHGKFMGFVDSDDWIEPDMYESLYAQADEIDLVTSGIWKYDRYGSVEQVTDLIEAGIYDVHDVHFINNLMICSNYEGGGMFGAVLNNLVCKLFRSSIVRACFNMVDVGVVYGEDLLFTIVYILRCRRIAVTHACYYHYRYNAESITNVKDINYLEEQNKIYKVLEQTICGHQFEAQLRNQLERMVMFYVCSYTSAAMHFALTSNFPKFKYKKVKLLMGKRIVLFGAGKVGQSYYFEWKSNFDIHIVLWVDNRRNNDKVFGHTVMEPKTILSVEYDYVVCAIQNREQYAKIKKQLLELGIEEKKILWEQPINVFEEYFIKGR